MKHGQKGRKFGRVRKQRTALFRGLASSFFIAGKMKTTEAKAKALRPFVEKCITRGKNPTLANQRILRRDFSSETARRIIKGAVLHKDRAGGYTRITKMGSRRSDNARMAILEMIG